VDILYKTPEQFLKHTLSLATQLSLAKKKEIVIGLPSEKATGKVYKKSGKSIIEVGSQHEYGIGVPQRSFLRMPLAVKQKRMSKSLYSQFKLVISKNKDVKQALGIVGASAYNIIQEAFLTGGFGRWKALSEYTIEQKDSTKILIDSGKLKLAIAWVVRDVT